MAYSSVTSIGLVIATMGLATFATRIVPFLVFRKVRIDERVRYVGTYLPLMITFILVVYSFKDVKWSMPYVALSHVAGGVVTLQVQLLSRNALLSIAAGVGVYALVSRFS